MKNMFESLGESVLESDILMMISYADKDEDGYLNFE